MAGSEDNHIERHHQLLVALAIRFDGIDERLATIERKLDRVQRRLRALHRDLAEHMITGHAPVPKPRTPRQRASHKRLRGG